MTCKRCRIKMLELKGHIYHGARKFRCPSCGTHRMQKPKETGAKGESASA